MWVGIGEARGGLQQQQQSVSRKTYRKCLFVQSLGDWGRRPPSFVGGGIDMKLLGNLCTVANTDEMTNKYVEVTKGLVHPEYKAMVLFGESERSF